MSSVKYVHRETQGSSGEHIGAQGSPLDTIEIEEITRNKREKEVNPGKPRGAQGSPVEPGWEQEGRRAPEGLLTLWE